MLFLAAYITPNPQLPVCHQPFPLCPVNPGAKDAHGAVGDQEGRQWGTQIQGSAGHMLFSFNHFSVSKTM